MTSASTPARTGGRAPSAVRPLAAKPRTAFLCRTDADGLADVPALLRSMALTNPECCEDFVLLHTGPDADPDDPDAGLPAEAVAALRRLHPRILVRARRPAGDGTGHEDGSATGHDSVHPLESGWLLRPGLAVQRTPDDAERRRYLLDDEEFRAAYCALPGGKHPELLLHLGVPLLAARPTVDLARTIGLAHYDRGCYREAAEVLAGADAKANQPRFHETLGSALMACSRYDEAETHLLLATVSPEVAPKAFSRLARLAWLRGDEATARERARQGLDAEPVNRTCRALHLGDGDRPDAAFGRGAQDGPEGEPLPPEEQLAHAALYASGQENAGDKVLPEAVRRSLSGWTSGEIGPRGWHPVPVHRLFDEAALDEVNARRGLVVGGGGLFLPDTWPNGTSGWQWNVPDELLARITVPLAVFAVGFNVFDGQSYARDRFTGSLRTLVERSAFFGLRNRGSVEKVRELLPAELREKVGYQPCPTTVMRLLAPGGDAPVLRDGGVLLNCAYDRAGLRFGRGYGHFLAEMADAVRRLRTRADVRYAPHTPADERFVHDLRREHGISLPVEPLYDLDNARVLDVYRRAGLVIGMRGHAGMIPFGCGTPVLSLVSHPKLAYFLADIDRPEWGVSVHDRQLSGRLTERAFALLDDQEAAVADVHGRQELLWRTTRENLAVLAGHLGAPAAAAVPEDRRSPDGAAVRG